MARTILKIQNKTTKEVKTYLTLGVTKGCIQNVKDIPFVTDYITDLQGFFYLKPLSTIEYKGKGDLGLNGNLSFGSPPMNCPTLQFKSGINLAEFILNNGFQGEEAQETVDISAVAGVNCVIEFSLISDNPWNAGSKYPDVKQFKNTVIGENAGRIGVYPYGCDECTESVNPPNCPRPPLGAPNPPIPQEEPICNVQRDASKSGGIVLISFFGFIEDN